MIFERIDDIGIIKKGVNHLILAKGKDTTKLEIRSAYDYELLLYEEFQKNAGILTNIPGVYIVYHHQSNSYATINTDNFEQNRVASTLFPEFQWSNLTMFCDTYESCYKIFDNHLSLKFVYRRASPKIIMRWVTGGIVEVYKNEKVNNWLKCLDPNGDGQKRTLSDWVLLGNGKLILKTFVPSAARDKDLMCLFDPIENLQNATIIDGRRTD